MGVMTTKFLGKFGEIVFILRNAFIYRGLRKFLGDCYTLSPYVIWFSFCTAKLPIFDNFSKILRWKVFYFTKLNSLELEKCLPFPVSKVYFARERITSFHLHCNIRLGYYKTKRSRGHLCEVNPESWTQLKGSNEKGI